MAKAAYAVTGGVFPVGTLYNIAIGILRKLVNFGWQSCDGLVGTLAYTIPASTLDVMRVGCTPGFCMNFAAPTGRCSRPIYN